MKKEYKWETTYKCGCKILGYTKKELPKSCPIHKEKMVHLYQLLTKKEKEKIKEIMGD